MAKVPRDEIKRRVDEAVRILRIGPLLNRKPRQLSGGQRQRLAIGRAIVPESKISLFGEPLSHLDAELRTPMRMEIATLHRDLGITKVYVTHHQIEAMTLADRIVVLRGGRVEQIGSPATLYDRPANTFVAGFIDSPNMNLIEAARRLAHPSLCGIATASTRRAANHPTRATQIQANGPEGRCDPSRRWSTGLCPWRDPPSLIPVGPPLSP
jgi:lactose/L-arabinose transport system ATP-binding protein